MEDLNTFEKFLLNKIKDNTLKQSIISMRNALLLIWKQNDAPILIRDFVHHNILHSQKLAYFAVKIIKSNKNLHLIEQEVYLLLAGIYLHDIGMQCELYKFPEIKKEAERLGAIFSNEYFTQRPSSELSPEEQKELRNNHQFVSAAWIGVSYLDKETKTPLYSSAKTLPNILVEDIKKICMYHSKLDITKCDLINVRRSEIRVQLIAAILRYCDELDIEMDKVNIDVVNSYRYDAERVKYHHMHAHTCIDFQKNTIKITVALHPEDINEISKQKAFDLFIQKFIDKNKSVQQVLQKNDIHLYYDGCDVLEDINSAKIPNEVLRLLINDAKVDNKNVPATRKSFGFIVEDLNINRNYLINKSNAQFSIVTKYTYTIKSIINDLSSVRFGIPGENKVNALFQFKDADVILNPESCSEEFDINIVRRSTDENYQSWDVKFAPSLCINESITISTIFKYEDICFLTKDEMDCAHDLSLITWDMEYLSFEKSINLDIENITVDLFFPRDYKLKDVHFLKDNNITDDIYVHDVVQNHIWYSFKKPKIYSCYKIVWRPPTLKELKANKLLTDKQVDDILTRISEKFENNIRTELI